MPPPFLDLLYLLLLLFFLPEALLDFFTAALDFVPKVMANVDLEVPTLKDWWYLFASKS